jgi:hypothetical protein
MLDFVFHLDFQANFFLENSEWQRAVSCFIWEHPLYHPGSGPISQTSVLAETGKQKGAETG